MGEPIKSILTMANGRHRKIQIKEGDLVYIVTTPSIEMETAVAKTEDVVYRAGGVVKMINENLRVSGHANPNDLKLMINLLKPKNLIPIQGEYRQLAALVEIAEEVGIDQSHSFITRRGDVLSYEEKTGKFIPNGSVPSENVMIDGSGVGDIGNIVLRDRKILSEDGILIAVATISRREKRIVSSPQVTSRGFVFQKTSRDILKESGAIMETILEAHLAKPDFEWGMLKQEIREKLSRYLFEETKRRPVVMPVIMEGTPKQ
jgi:ribonuclease J